ncbi:hypothetical protein [Chryseobacterium turcicum]|uniref:Uncharacterized protein n=1 Tax=Chryseobacterium turcicum TaxID=2898076 RepID=A0A9Q3YVJ3_9FLAO|nr:hypothetical protein [Chryseobacterium turcicum]MCD1116953.1 hypothetical protein [Chryseobacterium turcicum]
MAVKISLALSELNNSVIKPELGNEKTFEEFERDYNEEWIESIKYLSMDTFIQMFKEGKTDGGVMTFMGCIRDFYAGNYIIDTLSKGTISEEMFYDRLIEDIRKLQFIEDYEKEIEFPSVRIMDFPEGEKKIAIFPANYTVLLPKVDYVFLMKKNDTIAQVPYDDFIKYISKQAKRVDELQYIIHPINEIEHYKILLHFKTLENEKNIIQKGLNNETKKETKEEVNKIEKLDSKKWWKFWE